MGNQIVLAPEEIVAYIAKDNPGERIATKRNNTKRVCYLFKIKIKIRFRHDPNYFALPGGFSPGEIPHNPGPAIMHRS